tara:strand:- start:171 stop:947 length:777 start_codon:yes stop_codon:yes gene_type:complete
MKIIAIIQARMNSSRLPGKVMMQILDRPLIEHMIIRVKKAKLLDEIWLATSKNEVDNCLESIAVNNNIYCFRGKEKDVLSRFETIINKRNPDLIVRLTGDCPLADPNLIDLIVKFAMENIEKYYYVGNSLIPTFPDGLDVEVFTAKALLKASKKSNHIDREHVTPKIHKYHEKNKLNLNIGHFLGERDFSHLRLTLDEKEDFELIKIIFEKLYPQNENFSWFDIISLLTKEPHLISINSKFSRNESFINQLAKTKNRL